jgi:hypothetical protein
MLVGKTRRGLIAPACKCAALGSFSMHALRVVIVRDANASRQFLICSECPLWHKPAWWVSASTLKSCFLSAYELERSVFELTFCKLPGRSGDGRDFVRHE